MCASSGIREAARLSCLRNIARRICISSMRATAGMHIRRKGCSICIRSAITSAISRGSPLRWSAIFCIHALTTLGVPEVRAVCPRTLRPAGLERFGVRVFDSIDEGVQGADVIIMLRIQRERMNGPFLPDAREYFRNWGLTPERLARAAPDAIVMHPGPVNRGVEIESSVADGAQSVILSQVRFGIAVRMAVMSLVAASHDD